MKPHKFEVPLNPSDRHTSDTLKILFSVKESAFALGVSIRTIQNLVAARLLPVRRVGRRVLINRKDLERFARGDHPTIGGER